jgi:hypothetical protein
LLLLLYQGRYKCCLHLKALEVVDTTTGEITRKTFEEPCLSLRAVHSKDSWDRQ